MFSSGGKESNTTIQQNSCGRFIRGGGRERATGEVCGTRGWGGERGLAFYKGL